MFKTNCNDDPIPACPKHSFCAAGRPTFPYQGKELIFLVFMGEDIVFLAEAIEMLVIVD